jgi:hypothetical protein
LFSEVGLFPGEGKEIDTAFSPADFPQEYFAAIGSQEGIGFCSLKLVQLSCPKESRYEAFGGPLSEYAFPELMPKGP